MENRQNSTNINWFPGHMVVAKKQIKESLGLVDVVIEIIDARIPISSRNPDFDELVGNKPRVIALNKSDLADPVMNKKWIEHFKKQGIKAILMNSITGVGIKEVLKAANELMKEKLEKEAAKGRVGRSVRAAVMGIPNSGKSSFINKVSGKNAVEVGNKPGVTRKKQWIRTNQGVELMDTPGILWPKFEDEKIGLHLAYTSAIRYEILDNTELAINILVELKERYKSALETRYKLTDIADLQGHEILEVIGRKRGCMVAGGNVDLTKAANIVIEEFRKGTIGKITLEVPN